MSLNQLMVTILAKEVGRARGLNRVEQKVDRLLDGLDAALEKERMPVH